MLTGRRPWCQPSFHLGAAAPATPCPLRLRPARGGGLGGALAPAQFPGQIPLQIAFEIENNFTRSDVVAAEFQFGAAQPFGEAVQQTSAEDHIVEEVEGLGLAGRFCFESFDFLADQAGDAVFGQVHLGRIDSERGFDLRQRPVFDDVQVEDLKLLRLDPFLHAMDGGVDEVLLPFLLPNSVEAFIGWFRRSGHQRCVGGGVRRRQRLGRMAQSLAELVLDAPGGGRKRPAVEVPDGDR